MKILSFVFLLFTLVFPNVSYSVTIIFDTEIDGIIKEITDRLVKVSSINDEVRVYIIHDDSINAFTPGKNQIYLHSGLILNSHTPDMLAGVIAHELGHIQGGHNITRTLAHQESEILNIGIMLLGITGIASNSEALTAASSMSAVLLQKNLLKFSRNQEIAADIASINLLNKAGFDTSGLIKILEHLSRYDKLFENDYSRTHPFAKDRIKLIKSKVYEQTKASHQIDFIERYQMAVKKLEAYITPEKGKHILNRIKSKNDKQSLYQKTIIYMRNYDWENAAANIEQLISMEPKNPYFHELKADIYFNQKKLENAREAIDKALLLSRNEALLLYQAGIIYATSYNLLKERIYLDKAINYIEQAIKNRKDAMFSRYLASLYKLSGNNILSEYYIAESYYEMKDYKLSLKHLEPISKKVDKNDPIFLKIDDLITIIKKEGIKN